MKDVLTRYKIDGLWHFTDRSNLALVKQQNGLLSLGEILRREVVVPAPGGNQWSHDADQIKGLDEYVHLTFVDNHPMLFIARQEGRITDPVWLKIDASILLVPGVRFTNDVSNKAGVQTMGADEAAEQIDCEVLFTRTDWKDPAIMARRRAAEKSEILVPSVIPLDKILGYKNG